MKNEAKKLKLKIKPEIMMADFEQAVFGAFEDSFPGIVNKGCLFHFSQSLLRSFGKFGMKEQYSSDPQFNSWLKWAYSLALLPLENGLIDAEWLKIKAQKPNHPGIDSFIQYFESTYMSPRCAFPRSIWNHFDTIGPRTNNHLEGYHSKLKKFFGAAHPDILLAIAHIRADANKAELEWHRSLPPNPLPPQPRHRRNIWKDANFDERKRMFVEDEISIETNIKYNIRNYDFDKNLTHRQPVAAHSDISDEEVDSGSDTDDGEPSDAEVDELEAERFLDSLVIEAAPVSVVEAIPALDRLTCAWCNDARVFKGPRGLAIHQGSCKSKPQ